MAEFKQTVLMTQLDDEQGRIWQSALISQEIEVLWEASDTDLVELLKSMQANGIAMPDLLLMDMAIKSPNSQILQSGLVCQWCAKNEPKLKVVLFNPRQDKIKEVERGWAIRRGAVDVLPKLYQSNLLSSVKRVVDEIRAPWLEERLKALVESAPTDESASSPISEVPTGKSGDITKAATSSESTNKSNKPSGMIYRGVRVKKS